MTHHDLVHRTETDRAFARLITPVEKKALTKSALKAKIAAVLADPKVVVQINDRLQQRTDAIDATDKVAI